jgi:hypothetical protein
MEYSPILAVATAAFEIVAAGWALTMKSERRTRGVLRTTGAILLLLAGYQIAEVAICADVVAAGFLPRLAFLIVTWLPPLGLLLVAQLRRPRSSALYGSAFVMLAAAAGMVVWIALDGSFATASVCNAVYAHYTHAMPRFAIYAGFYWIGLSGMILGSGIGVASTVDVHRRRQLGLVLSGTLAFVVPGLAVSWLVPPTRGALPSILCHFALLLAISLARVVHLERGPTAETGGRAVSRIG